MNQDEDSEARRLRGLFRNLLSLLSDATEQRGYEQAVPIANVPAELVCMWFDDHYHPNQQWFLETFTPREQEILAQFNRAYEECLPRLPLNSGFEALHSSPQWAKVMTEARNALEALGWD